jgi:hypothetical protein
VELVRLDGGGVKVLDIGGRRGHCGCVWEGQRGADADADIGSLQVIVGVVVDGICPARSRGEEAGRLVCKVGKRGRGRVQQGGGEAEGFRGSLWGWVEVLMAESAVCVRKASPGRLLQGNASRETCLGWFSVES